MTYFAENVDNAVARIIAAPSAAWCETNLGGTWIELGDPYEAAIAKNPYNWPTLGSTVDAPAGDVSTVRLIQPPLLDVDKMTVWPDGNGAIVISTAFAYTAWPYGNLHYDATRQKLWLLFMQGSGHTADDRSVWYAEIDVDTETASTPVEIAPALTNPATSRASNCSAVLANGDYLMLTFRQIMGVSIDAAEQWRSTDGGATWVNEGWIVDENDVELTFETGAPVAGLFVTASGAIITGTPYDYYTPTNLAFVRSTDNGAHWTVTLSDTALTRSIEPNFFQDPTSGRIVAYWRTGNIAEGAVPSWCYSDDDGVTWSDIALMPNHMDANDNPGAFLVLADDDLVELYYGCRSARYGSSAAISRVTASLAQAITGNWSGADPIVTNGAANFNFGYCAVRQVGSKVFMVWYHGSSSATNIHMKVGARPA